MCEQILNSLWKICFCPAKAFGKREVPCFRLETGYIPMQNEKEGKKKRWKKENKVLKGVCRREGVFPSDNHSIPQQPAEFVNDSWTDFERFFFFFFDAALCRKMPRSTGGTGPGRFLSFHKIKRGVKREIKKIGRLSVDSGLRLPLSTCLVYPICPPDVWTVFERPVKELFHFSFAASTSAFSSSAGCRRLQNAGA